MIVESTIAGGFTGGSEPFLRKGLNEFVYANLSRSQREFVDAMVQARVVKILERDPPPPDAELPPPADSEAVPFLPFVPKKKRGAARKAG